MRSTILTVTLVLLFPNAAFADSIGYSAKQTCAVNLSFCPNVLFGVQQPLPVPGSPVPPPLLNGPAARQACEQAIQNYADGITAQTSPACTTAGGKFRFTVVLAHQATSTLVSVHTYCDFYDEDFTDLPTFTSADNIAQGWQTVANSPASPSGPNNRCAGASTTPIEQALAPHAVPTLSAPPGAAPAVPMTPVPPIVPTLAAMPTMTTVTYGPPLPPLPTTAPATTVPPVPTVAMTPSQP